MSVRLDQLASGELGRFFDRLLGHDQGLEAIGQARRARLHFANVAFVPYGNMDDVHPGAALYGCALEMLFCHRVGTIVEVLQGEVSFKHPHREKAVRGQMIVVDLKDKDAAEDDVLFVGSRPLLL